MENEGHREVSVLSKNVYALAKRYYEQKDLATCQELTELQIILMFIIKPEWS